MSFFITRGGASAEITRPMTAEFLREFVGRLPGKPKKILLVPPDFTRFHSNAGAICSELYRLLSPAAEVLLLPALGTHRPMTGAEMDRMFPGVPHARIKVHDWQGGLTTLGEIPGRRLEELSGGRVHYPVRIEVDALLAEGG
ncbi:MAG: DUF2088 domain-containing protein, partial [Lentisphaerae bacterium]|nr:DUF2088 domain-containing protein [Lentisphaerota bacterium]